MNLVLALLVAIAVFCGYLLIDKMRTDAKRRESLRERIAPDGTSSGAESGEDNTLGLAGDPSAGAKTILLMLRGFGINVEKASRKLERRFAQAGINSPDAPAYYLLFERVGSLVLVVIAALLAAGADSDNKLLMYTAALFLAAIGLFGPKLYLDNKILKRKQILQRAFPDTLDLLLICVESGLALDAALTRVCNELGRAYPEMTAELNRTRLELALINDRVRALMNLGDRTDMVAFRSLIAALIQSERFGTSLTDTLRVLSEEFRLVRLSLAEAKAARLPVLMTVPLILLLMPAFFLIVLGPAIVNIMNSAF